MSDPALRVCISTCMVNYKLTNSPAVGGFFLLVVVAFLAAAPRSSSSESDDESPNKSSAVALMVGVFWLLVGW